MSGMRREFADRDDLKQYLRDQFPQADGELSQTRGGRTAGAAALVQIQPVRYAATRNHLDGAVTRLSPYIRHAVVSLPEVLAYAREQVGGLSRIFKFVQELAWRDYYRRVHYALGDGVWEDREEYKTGWSVADYARELPADVENGQTGLACMDAFAHELAATGYLHNHARMWMAAYVVHWRRVAWQAGARWFLRHLLDGDPASNNLSWQWVASTFAGKPYFFNRENLERYTRGQYCRECPQRADCPFDAPYEELERRLFQ